MRKTSFNQLLQNSKTYKANKLVWWHLKRASRHALNEQASNYIVVIWLLALKWPFVKNWATRSIKRSEISRANLTPGVLISGLYVQSRLHFDRCRKIKYDNVHVPVTCNPVLLVGYKSLTEMKTADIFQRF